VDQFSFGFQMELPWSSMIEVSYVGSRGHNIQTERAYNIPGLDLRRQCNLLEGGSPAYCNAKLPNPFYQQPAFLGTSFYISPTLSRFQLARPFPQLRGEAFNVLNHYAFPLARFNSNPNDANFGSLFPGRVSTVDSGFPRQLRLGAKLLW
jgi:hypothetical protein